MKENCLAIIIARGGSKRIPRKNIKNFCGKPIISYSIEAALKSELFDEVMVSTEDVEIKTIAEAYGANVPFMRSDKNASDTAMTHEVILEVLEMYKKRGQTYDYVCCLYPTAPFITADKLRESWHRLKETGADTVLPIAAFSFPPQRCFTIKKDRIQFQWPEYRLTRSQDIEKWYHDCGQFYFFKTEHFINTHNLIMEYTVPIIVDEMEVQDIDTDEDWKLAELKYKLKHYSN